MEPQDTVSRDERLEVRLSAEEKQQIKDDAWRERVSMGELVRRRLLSQSTDLKTAA